MLFHQVGEIGEVTASSASVDFRPFALECFAGGRDSNVDILLGGLMDGDDRLLVARVDGLECLAIDAFYPFVVDEAVPRLLASCSGLVGWTLDSPRAGFCSCLRQAHEVFAKRDKRQGNSQSCGLIIFTR